jgi:rare lipoprotein A
MTRKGQLFFGCGILLTACLLVAACGGRGMVAPTEPQRDGAPSRAVDLSRIQPVVPRDEEIRRAGNFSPYTVFGKTYEVLPTSRGYREQGYASWYGTKFHGRLTSNGEVYDMYQFTAAHKSLPIPAYVLVHNLENGRELIVRVNDRGPFHDNRIIDLSWAAAAKLGFADQGVARVEVVALDPSTYQVTLAELSRERAGLPAQIPPPELVAAPDSWLQVAALSTAEAARNLADSVAGLTDLQVVVLPPPGGDILYRVQVGPLREPGSLGVLQTLLELNGLPQGVMVRRVP